ncbi:MAG: hypothetical protein KU37_08680 [Sulfuricurvum sp. PC08-66]|nr:MAG: hypothetical protein KU37_08680 [Sulfuricurvum sp. PC08-66]
MEDAEGFDWDDGNSLKNERKHNLSWQTIEELFFNEPLILLKDEKHSSATECRCAALGSTDDGVLITAIFTKRETKIRVISARPMSKKERVFYEKTTRI